MAPFPSRKVFPNMKDLFSSIYLIQNCRIIFKLQMYGILPILATTVFHEKRIKYQAGVLQPFQSRLFPLILQELSL